jgi:peptidoglycan/xylan/chitin deacetylase (PgdA/CDA1 family)
VNVILTIDVECYSGDYEREVFAGGLGLEYLLSMLSRYDAVATFFVEALGATQWGKRPLETICRRLREAGQDIQLHLHPVVARIPGFEDTYDVLWDHDCETQAMLMKRGMELLHACGAQQARAFRAGDFAANETTLDAMRRAGLRIGSNRDLDQKSSIRSQLNDTFPIRNDVSACRGILDVPVTALRSRLPGLDGRYRHMEISAMGWGEMRDALQRMRAAGYTSATLLTHPREFFRHIHGKPVPIRKNCRRLEKLLEFVHEREGLTMVPVCPAVEVMTVPSADPPELTLKLRHTLLRMVEQVLDRSRCAR